MPDSSDLREALAVFLEAVDPSLMRNVLLDFDRVISSPNAAVMQARTLDEARAAVRVPEGCVVVSETIVLGDTPLTVWAFAAAVDEARVRANRLLPSGATVLEETVMLPLQETLSLEAPDAQAAQSWTLARLNASTPGRAYARAVKIVETDKGSQGIFGVGKRPSRYEVTASTDAAVVFTVRPQVIVGFEFGDASGGVRRAIVDRNWQLATQLGVPAIRSLLETIATDDTPGAREGAANALATIGRPALDPLVTALRGATNGKAWIIDVLGRIGAEEALEPLIAALSEQDWSVRDAAARALGRLGDARACVALEQSIERDRGRWSIDEPLKALWRLQYLQADDLSHIIGFLRDKNHGTVALALLEELGDCRAAEAVIDLLFAEAEAGSPARLTFKRLFRDYARVIADVAAGYAEASETRGRDWERVTDYSYDTSAMRRAVDKLCELDTPVSSNILHKVAGKKDVQVVRQWHEMGGGDHTTLSFQKMRDTATRVLTKRGNPAYAPSAYTQDGAWIWPKRAGRPKP